MTTKTCTFPKENEDPCRRPAVAYYIVGGERYYRCRMHDSKSAQNTAVRVVLEEVAA